MNIKKKLANPFALVAEGFVAGAILFYATAPQASEAKSDSASIAAVQPHKAASSF